MRTKNDRMTLDQAAAFLGYAISSLNDVSFRRERGIPTWKERGRVFFRRRELREWKKAQVKREEAVGA